jgi:hypothetical protein
MYSRGLGAWTLGISVIGCWIACRQQVQHPEKPATQAASTGELGQEELNRLRSLPYRAYSKEKAEPGKSGVVVFDRARSEPGYNLYVVRNLCRAELIDGDGHTLHVWDGRRRGILAYWSNCELQENGDLVVAAQYDWEQLLLRLSWNGELLWQANLRGHHDVASAPDGRLIGLAETWRRVPEFNRQIADNDLIQVAADGRLIERISLYDMVQAAKFPLQRIPASPTQWVRVNRQRAAIDLFHCNSVAWASSTRLFPATDSKPSPNYLLVSSRNQDAVFVIDWKKKALVWWWGQGELSGPHDASWLGNGNLLIFDNGLKRAWSRIVEVDPLARRIVWEYRAPRPTDFFSASRGSCQRLSNGNTLIGNSDSGQAFEVTREGEMVWEFFAPHLNRRGQRATIVRIRRHPTAWIKDLLDRQNP